MTRLPLIVAFVACAAVFFLMVRLDRLEKRIGASNKANGTVVPGATASKPEVAVYMGRIQVFANKLWSAGKAGNLPLADFYRHEMKEAMEELVSAGIVDDGVNVSEKMEVYGIRTLDALKAELKTNGLKDFDGQYATLVNTCNSCHAECGKAFIEMRVPTYTRYDDQVFLSSP